MNEKNIEEIKICRDWNEIICGDCEEYLNCELVNGKKSYGGADKKIR